MKRNKRKNKQRQTPVIPSPKEIPTKVTALSAKKTLSLAGIGQQLQAIHITDYFDPQSLKPEHCCSPLESKNTSELIKPKSYDHQPNTISDGEIDEECPCGTYVPTSGTRVEDDNRPVSGIVNDTVEVVPIELNEHMVVPDEEYGSKRSHGCISYDVNSVEPCLFTVELNEHLHAEEASVEQLCCSGVMETAVSSTIWGVQPYGRAELWQQDVDNETPAVGHFDENIIDEHRLLTDTKLAPVLFCANPSAFGKTLCFNIVPQPNLKHPSSQHQKPVVCTKFRYSHQMEAVNGLSSPIYHPIVPFDFSTPSPDDFIKEKQKQAFRI